MTNWESVSDVPWYNNKGSITNVVIEDGVTIIGESAFYDCDKLTTITIRNPECKIYDDEYTISSTATIYGYEGSTAQAYAEKYERTFVTLEEELDVEIIASGECGAEGDNLTWTLDTEGTITISGEGL